jgi:two-component sensor histidine kinase
MAPRTATKEEDAALSLTLAVVASSAGPLLLLDGDLNVVAVSTSFCRAFGIDPASAQGRQVFDLGAGEWNIPRLRSLLTATAAGDAGIDACEIELRRPGRQTRELTVHAERLAYLDLEQVRLLLAVTDATDANTADRQREEVRRQNALLVKEARHRVANSLQIIASVLMQDARRTQSEETRSRLHGAHHRVMSVAAMERHLAGSGEAQVQLRPYLAKLCETIRDSMIHDPERISLHVAVEERTVEANVSVSLGLITTELVINALKYAFPGERGGRIVVGYAIEGAGWALTVHDDGVGFAMEAAEPGLGTSIVRALAAQLRAHVAVSKADPGTTVAVAHTPEN